MSVTVDRKDWDSRYICYCAANGGLLPEETLKRDEEKYPGGCMCGFLLWSQGMIRKWVEHNIALTDSQEAKQSWNGVRDAPIYYKRNADGKPEWDRSEDLAYDIWMRQESGVTQTATEFNWKVQI